MIKISVFLLLIFSLSSCKLNKEIIKNNQTSYWEISTLEKEGINALTIDSINQEIKKGIYGSVDHFLLLRNGKIVFDQHYTQNYDSTKSETVNPQYNYDNTAFHPYLNKTDLHTLQSITKSITSILFGIAVDEGYIKDINGSFSSYFKDYQIDTISNLKNKISLEHLLTMQSGIKWNEEKFDLLENNCLQMEASKDWIQYVLDQPIDTIPGISFNYNSGVSILLGKIIKEATGKEINVWAEEKLFNPLGISNYYWKKTPKGEFDTEGGLYLNIYDLAKIGYLMMNNGKWENTQIVSQKWVEKSTKPIINVTEKLGYGYQWWIPKHSNQKTNIFAGNGYGDQFVMVAPDYKIIAIFFGWNHQDHSKKSTWRILEKRILPTTILK